MEPRIQYAKTSDGVNIAYAMIGAGRPLVACPAMPQQQLSYVLQAPTARRFFDELAEDRLLVLYDSRGFGLSERNVTDMSLEARVLDLEAVIQCARLRTLALWGSHTAGGPVAIAYAATHQGEVTHLILYGTAARADEAIAAEGIHPLIQLCRSNWDLAAQTLGDLTWRKEFPEEAVLAARVLRDSMSGDVMAEFLSQLSMTDVSGFLPQISVPTLVFAFRVLPDDQRLAAELPTARLVLLEGTPAPIVVGDTQTILDAINSFLGKERRPARLRSTEQQARAPTPPSGMTAILFADIVDSTALTERLGDAAFREKTRELDRALRTVIRDNAGTPIEGKLLGDGVLAAFTSARQAIEAALACGRAGDDAGLPLHLGLHAGDVIREDNNVYGGAVNIASRISGLSAPGEVLVSETVRSLARTSAGVSFEDRGEQALKGVGEPVRVWAVREGDV